jgi:putative membrane-bound dehydrogenase-like protein
MIDPQHFRPRPYRERPWQFGLRGLLITITLVAVGCAYWAYVVKRERLFAQRKEEYHGAQHARRFNDALQIARLTKAEFSRRPAASLMLVEAELSAELDRATREFELQRLNKRLDSSSNRASPEFFNVNSVPVISVPPGFEVSLAAAAPLVQHPIMAGFDDRGRLFVAENAGLNLPKAELEKQLPNSVVLLTDTDDDGRFDKRTVFADKLTFPQGALWHDGWLYVASSGGIWRFRDTTGDDVADERQIIVGKFGYTGNAADVHGCFLGPEGRIYWCEGRHGHEITNAAGELVSKGKAARIFSCEPDGSDVRTHCGGGMDNPTEIDWTAAGEMLGTVNIFYHQRGDCLVHWLHGGVYPRHDQPAMLAEFRRTGEPLDAVHDFGHVAVSGLCRYRPFSNEKQGFGREWNDNWFVTEFNTHQVKRVQLTREGSSFRAQVSDFFKSTNGDSHPTDVLPAADGSLLVIDTGGWFRSGCPTSQIAKPDVLGAIYRVRRTGAKRPDDPWGAKIAWNRATGEELLANLGDERPAVRSRATQQLVHTQAAAIPYLARGIADKSELRRGHAAEALTRIGSPAALAVLRGVLENRATEDDPALQQRAALALGAKSVQANDPALLQSVDALTSLLAEEVAAEVQLAAATALGRIGEPAAIPEILAALARKTDRPLEHAFIYALIEIYDPAETRAGLAHESSAVQRAALMALDQMPSGDLRREEVAALLATEDVALQTAALDVIRRREGWTKELVTSVQQLLDQPELTEPQQALVVSTLVGFARQAAVQELLATQLSSSETSVRTKRLLLDAVAQASLSPVPQSLQAPLKATLLQPELSLAAIAAVHGSAADFSGPLRTLATDNLQPAEVRLSALAALSQGEPLEWPSIAWLMTQFASNTPPAHRMLAARTLGASKLSRDQKIRLCDALTQAGPLEISSLLAAFEHPGDGALGERLAASLLQSPGKHSLSLSQLKALMNHYPRGNFHTLIQPLLDRLQLASETQRQRLDELSSQLAAGDAQAGKQVFTSRQVGCALCHRVGKNGGQIGPDLSTIGQRRNARDLLEAIVFPSASFARGFESHAFQLADGRTLSGLIVRESADMLVVRGADQRELRVPRQSIEQMKPSETSIMPAGLDSTMSRAQLADLLAYLQSLK